MDLAAHPCDYLYSLTKFYYNNDNSFDILQHCAEESDYFYLTRLRNNQKDLSCEE